MEDDAENNFSVAERFVKGQVFFLTLFFFFSRLEN